MRLLIDECLSPALVGEAHRLGYDATAVRDRGALRETDRAVVRRAVDGDFVIVTNNAADFRDLCRAEGTHPGLIVMPQGLRSQQIALLGSALAYVERRAAESASQPRDFMFNRVVEVDAAGQCEDAELPSAPEE